MDKPNIASAILGLKEALEENNIINEDTEFPTIQFTREQFEKFDALMSGLLNGTHDKTATEYFGLGTRFAIV